VVIFGGIFAGVEAEAGTEPLRQARMTKIASSPVALGTLARETNTHTHTAYTSLLNKKETEIYNVLIGKLNKLPENWATKTHIRRIERFLPLAAATDRVKMFATLAEESDWGPKTMCTYWGCIRSGMENCQVTPTPEDVKYGTILHRASTAAESWDFEDTEVFLDQAQVDYFTNRAETALSLGRLDVLLVCYVALTWGQRVGDVLKVQSTNVFLVEHTRISVTFVEGKTIPRTGAYTLHATASSLLGKILQWLVRIHPQGRLFGLPPTQEAERRWERQVHTALPFKMDLRALRRTGLSRLALIGLSNVELLEISRHSSVQMLQLYLGRGLFDFEQARRQTWAVDRLSEVPMFHIQRMATMSNHYAPPGTAVN